MATIDQTDVLDLQRVIPLAATLNFTETAKRLHAIAAIASMPLSSRQSVEGSGTGDTVVTEKDVDPRLS